MGFFKDEKPHMTIKGKGREEEREREKKNLNLMSSSLYIENAHNSNA